jgi:uncharacterized protein YbjT (DUF2867 family)
VSTLITDGTGLIGTAVAKLLAERGEKPPVLFDLRLSNSRVEALGRRDQFLREVRLHPERYDGGQRAGA